MKRLLENPQPADGAKAHRVAAAALMVECARIEPGFSDEDRRLLAGAMQRLFELEADEADMLLAVAEERAAAVWHDWLFTQAIRRGFDAEARRRLVVTLCDVAMRNGVLAGREERFLRRIARELEVSEEVVVACREKGAGSADTDSE